MGSSHTESRPVQSREPRAETGPSVSFTGGSCWPPRSPACPLSLHKPLKEGWLKGNSRPPLNCPHSPYPRDTHSLLERVPWSPRILKNKMLGFVVSTTTSTPHRRQ